MNIKTCQQAVRATSCGAEAARAGGDAAAAQGDDAGGSGAGMRHGPVQPGGRPAMGPAGLRGGDGSG